MAIFAKALGVPVLVAIVAVLFKAVTTPSLGDLEPVDLAGKTFVVTGATSGLGSWHAEQLAAWNASLVLPVRDVSRGLALADRLERQYPGAPRAVVEKMDLSSLASVAGFAEKYKGPVDVLVHNAAVLGSGTLRRTEDGFEECFQVNYLSTVLLTSLFLDRLEQSPGGGRIVHVSAKAHEYANVNVAAMMRDKVLDPDFVERRNFVMGNLAGSYADSKLAQLLFSAALQRRLRGGAVSHGLHPAITTTELIRDLPQNAALDGIRKVMMKAGELIGFTQSSEDAPKTQVHVSTHPALQASGGRYFSPLDPPLTRCGRPVAECGLSEVSATAKNTTLQEEVFRASCELLGLWEGLCGRQPQ